MFVFVIIVNILVRLFYQNPDMIIGRLKRGLSLPGWKTDCIWFSITLTFRPLWTLSVKWKGSKYKVISLLLKQKKTKTRRVNEHEKVPSSVTNRLTTSNLQGRRKRNTQVFRTRNRTIPREFESSFSRWFLSWSKTRTYTDKAHIW